jgi:site-specific DNA recombinase
MQKQLDGYIRVSRIKGREGESFISPRVQREKIEAWARLNDVTLGVIEEELDVSGGIAPEARKLERLLRRCEQGLSRGIVTWRLDRFSRSASDTLAAAKRLKDSGARLVGIDDGVDTARAGGQLVLTVMAGLAEEQRDQARENWRTARREASKRGVYLTGHPPTGFVRSESGGLVPDPATAPEIAEAYKLRAAGASFQAVADYLTERGALPRAGARKNGAARMSWSREGVRQLLQNPVYAGKPRGSNGEAVIEPVVSTDLWGAAQIQARAYPTGSGRTKVLLTGLIRCGGCGHALHAMGRGPSYSCRGHYASGACPSRAVASAARTDAFVEDLFWRTLEAGEVQAIDEGMQARYLEARASVENAEIELDAWVQDVSLRTTLGDERFRRGIEARQEALDNARRTLADTPDPGIPADATIVYVNGTPAVYPDWETPEQRRALMSRYISHILLHRADPARRKWQPIEERVEIVWRGASVAA